MVRKIDGHVHFHYPTYLPNRDLVSDINRIINIGKENEIEEFLGIFRKEDLNKTEPFLKNKIIHPGIYVRFEEDEKPLKEVVDKFDFAKLHPERSFFHIIEYLDRKIEECTEAGFEKVQIHTDEISHKFLNLIEKYVDERDMNIYLVHGAGALYGLGKPTPNQDKIEKLKRLKDNVFLGTSTPGKSFMSGYLENPVKEFKNQLVYESDVIPDDKYFWYRTTIEEVKNSSSNDKNIFYNNIQNFLNK